MTDDRDQSWRAFDDEPTEERLEDEPRWEPSTNSETGKTLSRVLRRHEKAIDRTLAAIDNAIDDLRDAAGESPQEQKSDPGPAFPWRGPEASEESAATASQSVRSESTSAGMAKADASSGADKHKSVPPDAAAKPAPQAEPKPTPATASQAARSESPSAGMAKADASSGADQHKSMPPDAAAKPVPQAEPKPTPATASKEAASADRPRASTTQGSARPEPAKEAAQLSPSQAGGVHTGEKPQVAGQGEQAKPTPQKQSVQPATVQNRAAPTDDKLQVARQAETAKPVAGTVEAAKPAPQKETVSGTPLKAKQDTSSSDQTQTDQPPTVKTSRPAWPKVANESVSRAADARGESAPDVRIEPPAPSAKSESKAKSAPSGMVVLEADRGPVKAREHLPGDAPPSGGDKGRGGGGGGGGGVFHKRLGPVDFSASLKAGLDVVKKNLMIVMLFTIAGNILVLAIPVYLFQISDRVLTSRSEATLVMLTIVIVGAVLLQAVFDALRRFILMRTAVEVAAQLGAPILSAAARASLNSNGKEYQTLGDLGQLRSFLTSGTLLALLDAPMAPFFILAVFLIHPHQGYIVVVSSLVLLAITLANQRATATAFSEANASQSKANLHLDSMTRNSQIINALAMIPEAVRIWGKDTASSLKAQVIAQDRNIAFASMSKAVRLLTQVALLGWGAYLAIEGHVTGGMVIAASIIAGRALGPIEGAIEGWNHVVQSRAAFGRIAALLRASPLNFERLNLPRPEGRLDVERLLFVPQGTKRVVLNGLSFSLTPGDSLAVIGNSGAGKTTLGKMLVGSILPTSGNVRLDLMDLRNWDQRQFGENIGYLPQDVQLFPASIKANIARMREDATDAEIFEAAQLADVHDMIATLPHGYETFVAADGAPLSGGQKQRVALARAFFGNPRLVVLDEPNSNLDAAGDVALARALQHAKEQKITVITITQRPALLQSVDKILLLVNGTVALFGMRQEVLQALASRGLSIEGGNFGHQLQ